MACAYCYIYDMGFPGSAKPYKLSPLQLAYAVATNPHVAVGPWGTLVATGSVTEPFLPQTRELALGYMKAIAAYLDNPHKSPQRCRRLLSSPRCRRASTC